MIEILQGSAVWIVTLGLLIAGLVGCVIPIIPGHLLILAAAIGYRLMLGPDAGLAWWSFAVLILLLAISQIFEILSGSLGSKWFGGSKWGAVGALLGGIVGLFFMPFGLLLGPLAGAFSFELAFGRKTSRQSAVSGVGSVVGTIAGMGIKIIVGISMVIWFFLDIWVIGA